MNFRRLLLLVFSFATITAAAQADTSRLRISLLTCSPGAELYSTFGHTAIRVVDSVRGTDMVYNYGTFDDSDPNFYVKFTQGLMRYALSCYAYDDFLREYQYEKRGVEEQNLLLTVSDKQLLYMALLENAKEENRFYNYYFHADNCTTRARDMITLKPATEVRFGKFILGVQPTYRYLIHKYLDAGDKDWSKLGIDFLLGSNLDVKITDQQAMFLPEVLAAGVDHATIYGAQRFVEKSQTVLARTSEASSASIITPLFVFSVLLTIVVLLSFVVNKKKWAGTFLNVFDCIFFLFVGFWGVLMVTLWAIRVDDVCRNNFNIGWALPTHFIVAFVVYLKRKWLQTYFRITFALTLLFALAWFVIPQQMNTAVLPILGIILFRSYARGNLSKKLRASTTNTSNVFRNAQTSNVEVQ